MGETFLNECFFFDSEDPCWNCFKDVDLASRKAGGWILLPGVLDLQCLEQGQVLNQTVRTAFHNHFCCLLLSPSFHQDKFSPHIFVFNIPLP